MTRIQKRTVTLTPCSGSLHTLGAGPVVDALVVASCLHRMAANRASLYAIRAKGEVQNAGVASVRERGVYFGFDD